MQGDAACLQRFGRILDSGNQNLIYTISIPYLQFVELHGALAEVEGPKL